MYNGKCIVCNRELPVDETQLICKVGDHFYGSCLQHERSKELQEALKRIKKGDEKQCKQQ